MLPIRAKAMDAAERMKSPARIAWRTEKNRYWYSCKEKRKSAWADFISLTFLSPQISLMVLFPLRLSDPSITSSCTRLAVWIISEIIAMALCPGSKSLRGQTLDYTSYNNLVITGCGATSSYNCIRGHFVLVVAANKTWDSDGIFWVWSDSILPRSVAVDVERPGHQDDYHGSDGLAFAIEVVVT